MTVDMVRSVLRGRVPAVDPRRLTARQVEAARLLARRFGARNGGADGRPRRPAGSR